MSHAIPRAAFKAMLATGNGNAIGIPYDDDRNAHLTSDTGDAPLLCDSCEREFNRNFDAPLINALKSLENEIFVHGVRAPVNFSANQLAHAVVSVAWRIWRSPAFMYSEVVLDQRDAQELDALLRLPTDDVLKNCTVRLARLTDPTPQERGGFGQELMGQFVKAPQVYSLRTKSRGKFDRFAMDWTMFGFLIHLIVPRFLYPRSKKFGGLKRDALQISAVPVDMLQYPPLMDALIAGYAAQEEGRLSRTLKKRATNRSVGNS
jgi:hypothetical protein